MIFKIYLLKHGASSIPEEYYVDSESKELALNALVFQNKIDISSYSTIIVVDLSVHIIKDTLNLNIINPIIVNDPTKVLLDLVISYNETIFKNNITKQNLKFTIFDAFRHGLIKLQDVLHYAKIK